MQKQNRFLTHQLNDAGKFQFDKALEKLKEKKLPEEKQVNSIKDVH